MDDKSDPIRHQQLEKKFIAHVEQLLRDERFRVQTSRGRRSVITLIRDVKQNDRGVDLKRLMSEMGRPDRSLESRLPVGLSIDVGLAYRKWGFIKTHIGRLRVTCVSPARALIAGQPAPPMSPADVEKVLAEIPPALGDVPSTLVLMSTAGFSAEAKVAARGDKNRILILASPNSSGGWMVDAGEDGQEIASLLDPEAETDKRARIRAELEASRVDLQSGGIASDRLASRMELPRELVESELKSYARANAGLTAKKLDGRLVLFREASAPSAANSGGLDMPFMDRMKTLFSRKGEVEKKIAFLSERRTALGQQLERGYEDMGAMEVKEGDLRQQFKDATGDITRRRITSQLLQLRKDLERRQQLLSVLNQQINVVSTHLHNLELQQQGKTASLPDSDEMAADAAAAEDVLAELQAGSELAESVGSTVHGGMSSEEQALYEELLNDSKTPEAQASLEKPQTQNVKPPPIPGSPVANRPAQRRTEPEAG